MMDDKKKRSILMVAGEASGDLHGAFVVREILKRDPSIHVYGVGGVEMKKAGMHLIGSSSDLASTGLSEIFSKLSKIGETFNNILRSADEYQPSLVILIDFPDFNLRLAKKLRKKGIPIIYYISPQVWCWRRYRTRHIKKLISKMLVVFPFELDFYKALGIRVEFVGHPLLDNMNPKYSLEEARTQFDLDPNKKTIALMPGSRKNEIINHLIPALKAAEKIQQAYPAVQFVLPLASTIQHSELTDAINQSQVSVKVVSGETHDVLAASDLVICCSGTATLEAAILGKPMVIILKLNRLTYLLGSLFFSWGVEFFGLPNIIAARRIVPELLQLELTPDNITRETLKYLRNDQYRQATSEQLLKVRELLGKPGSATKVVDQVFYYLDHTQAKEADLKPKLPYGEMIHTRVGRFFHSLLIPFLWLASGVYYSVIRFRRYLYWTRVLKPKQVSAKVISVGNITVGGTGKTPLTIHLAKELQNQGKKVAVLSRGYKRKGTHPWECVSDGSKVSISVQESGDEPMLMAFKLKGIPVYVGGKRYEVAKEILSRHPVDVLLLDDGFQHIKIARDFDFVTLDVSSFKKRDHLLPLGRFREPLSHIKRANCIVLTRTDHIDSIELDKIKKKLCVIHPSVPIIHANYQSRHLIDISSSKTYELSDLSGKRIYAFAGIGNPYSFKKVLQDLGGSVVGFSIFSDHFSYKNSHLEKVHSDACALGADMIITTEKDAIRISQPLSFRYDIPMMSLGVDLQITQGSETVENILRTF